MLNTIEKAALELLRTELAKGADNVKTFTLRSGGDFLSREMKLRTEDANGIILDLHRKKALNHRPCGMAYLYSIAE